MITGFSKTAAFHGVCQTVPSFSGGENLKKLYHLEDLRVDGKILKSISKKSVGRMCREFAWLRIGTKGGLP